MPGNLDINLMRQRAIAMRKDADSIEQLAAAIESKANLPTEAAKKILNAAGFRVIHGDSARNLLSLVLWAMEQECPDCLDDGETLEQLKTALEAA